MAEPHVITALVNKRSELAGDLLKLDKQRMAVKSRIANVDATLALFDYSGDPSVIAPRVRYDRLFKRGELTRLVADILRTTNGDLTNGEVASMVIEIMLWDETDKELLRRVAESVKPVTRRLR